MSDEQRIPPLPPGWQTSSMRKIERGGRRDTHDRNIRELAEKLTQEIAEQIANGNRDEAAALVEAHLIGIRGGERGPKALAASPDAQRILDQQQAPPLPPGWQTGSMRQTERGGRSDTHDGNIRKLADQLTDDIAKQATHGNRDEAAALVEHNLIGMRQGKKGPPAMAANPDAKRLLDEQEVLPVPPGWQTGNMQRVERGGDKRGGNNRTHNRNIRKLAEQLTQEIAEQVTAGNRDEAAALVEAHLIGIRGGERGPKALAASPDAQRILDEQEEAHSHAARLHRRRPKEASLGGASRDGQSI